MENRMFTKTSGQRLKLEILVHQSRLGQFAEQVDDGPRAGFAELTGQLHAVRGEWVQGLNQLPVLCGITA